MTTDKHRHRWRSCATTGRTTLRGMIVIERCSGCNEERRRKATRDEVAKRQQAERDDRKLHRLSFELGRKMKKHVGYAAMQAFERFVKSHPKEAFAVRVDDAVFANSDIGFFLNANEKELWCITGVYMPQCGSGDVDEHGDVSPRYFHLYPNHLENLYETVVRLRRIAMKYPGWRSEVRSRKRWMNKR